MTAVASIHSSAVVEEPSAVGAGTRIWHGSHVRAGSTIGRECTLGFSVYVDEGVVIGDRCKLQNHVSVFRGVVLADEVFVGPSAVFTNDLYPRACSPDWEVTPTHVGHGASIGANATIVCGAEIGDWAVVAAGAVVTGNVAAHSLVMGVPARHRGWACRCGRVLSRPGLPLPARCGHCGRVPDDVGAP